jgi:hypothetical protein
MALQSRWRPVPPEPKPGRDAEHGVALLTTVLLLVIVSGLTAAMVVSGRTDLLVARNVQSAAQAQAAAEAGLNHAIAVARPWLRNWEANGFTDSSDAVSRMLRGPDNLANTADDGGLDWLPGGFPRDTAQNLPGLNGVSYTAFLTDDDNVAPRAVTLSADDLVRIQENGQPASDQNRRFVVIATGRAPDNTSVTLEALLAPQAYPAILANGNVAVPGNATIQGEGGSIHANQNLTITGGPTIEEGATASGTATVSGNSYGGVAQGGAAPIPVPQANVADYYNQATYVLTSDGRILDRATFAVLCNTNATCEAAFRWTFFSAGGCGGGRYWYVAGNTAPPSGTYYVQADVELGGGFDMTGPGQGMTLLAEGDIQFGGSPKIRPHLQNILLVTNADLAAAGNTQAEFYGRIMVREQLDLAGSARITGQIMVQNLTNISPCVTTNQVRGSPTVTNDGEGVFDFIVRGWRDIRQ